MHMAGAAARDLRAAAKALYDGRSAGRNRVVMAESH